MTKYDKNPMQIAKEYSRSLTGIESSFEYFLKYIPEGIDRDDYKDLFKSFQRQAEFLKDYLSG